MARINFVHVTDKLITIIQYWLICKLIYLLVGIVRLPDRVERHVLHLMHHAQSKSVLTGSDHAEKARFISQLIDFPGLT